jgi:hypothetical protein
MIGPDEVDNAYTMLKDAREYLGRMHESFVKAEIEYREQTDPLYANLTGKNEAARNAELNLMVHDAVCDLDDAKKELDHAKKLYDLATFEVKRVEAQLLLLQVMPMVKVKDL